VSLILESANNPGRTGRLTQNAGPPFHHPGGGRDGERLRLSGLRLSPEWRLGAICGHAQRGSCNSLVLPQPPIEVLGSSIC